MKFGLNVINFGPSASAEAIAFTVEWAESAGFHLAMLSDHVAVTPDVGRLYPERFYEPFTTIAWLASRTSRIQLGTTVAIIPYRHVLLNARMSSQLAEFTGGRFILGVGVGWAQQEFKALGISFRQRGTLTDRFLADLPDEHPPIWVGGHSQAAIKRAARYADAWHPLNVPLDWLTTQGLPLLRRMAGDLGRPVPALAPRIRVRLHAEPLAEAERRPGQGDLQQIRRDLFELAELGAECVVLDTYHGNPDELANPEAMLRPVHVLLDQVIDLAGQKLR
jgi:alkanesulfonate monooxygenase SsuD/methylene tetrahydromethanopterin reductase-like flavin-dependent oxidoreductase (luciferase family)